MIVEMLTAQSAKICGGLSLKNIYKAIKNSFHMKNVLQTIETLKEFHKSDLWKS